MTTPSYRFPEDFVWGAAAASAQIEGAAREDGKGESIWDRFAATRGHIANGDTPATACDHYHRYEADAALMADLAIRNYRLSIAWPRIFPSGDGPVNPRGLDFYDRLIDSLLAAGITPWVTLFHWDLPQALEDRGGWLVRSTAEAFRPYAETVVKRLGDRVKNWFTLNEIPCFIGKGYLEGEFAPGRTESARAVNQGYHHALLAHGYAVSAVRSHGGSGARVGLVHNHLPPPQIPVIETDEHIAAARAEYERSNGQLMGPLFRGRYPEDFLSAAGADAPQVEVGDLAGIAQPMDFLGLNLYSGDFVRAGRNGLTERLAFPRQFPQGDLPWLNLTPQVLYWGVRHAAEVFGVPSFYITEHGAALADTINADGEVIDLDRREVMRSYLVELHRAVREGYDVRGYFAWSLLDNFEWAEGYAKRFGIVHVDFATQKRTPKLSAHWYSQVIRENRLL
ncbi:beta-glucosidase [Singulisphaera sp. GP187]|uniref:GH1 family beta-glucosidase n=1 Tax=Singulisphaera sp. GP187 TaxID=1882752 RepID=UPI000926ABEA|nr:GH1 family beta-glucosidase [Singulisphaera sp. GP187]SIO60289.1 beta-glucosidase [Singulisphaera sp. GP187]